MSNSALRRGRRCVPLLGALLLASCTQNASPVTEKLFDATRRDLGGVRVESDYSAAYRITNLTPGPITITGITTSCGCVAAEYDRSEIAPGAQREIILNLSTHEQNSLGPIVKHASVEFGSGETVRLTLEARLESDFDVDPRRLEFSADHRTHKLTLTRRALDPRSFSELVLVAPSERYDAVETLSSAPDRREFEITMKEAPAGTALPDIYFAHALGAAPLPFSTVVSTRTGPSLRPSACVVVTDGASRPPAQRFELVDFKSQPMKLTAVEPLDESSRRTLEVSFDPLRDSRSFSVGLAGTAATATANLFVAVSFEAVDGGASGRLLLPCHIVTTGKSTIAND